MAELLSVSEAVVLFHLSFLRGMRLVRFQRSHRSDRVYTGFNYYIWFVDAP